MRKSHVYIEQRTQKDFAVRREGSERASAVAPTQAGANALAREMFPDVDPNVERVRHTSAGKPDQWRKA